MRFALVCCLLSFDSPHILILVQCVTCTDIKFDLILCTEYMGNFGSYANGSYASHVYISYTSLYYSSLSNESMLHHIEISIFHLNF